ncbi:armadillo-type protein [Piptocephalis cylindrospora]|uniref:Armadillo-type protein n=1 Tax=Piptocephalis cylindrospora TaxID=1907219 RepID=A0A4P9Y8Q1_9FUNG|nr:armadillo-type protein [Piptocephalis cylindrospora]|eukprot:RKP14741.1 armadillo-type protein [Piptocephalis cylindrospora]
MHTVLILSFSSLPIQLPQTTTKRPMATPSLVKARQLRGACLLFTSRGQGNYLDVLASTQALLKDQTVVPGDFRSKVLDPLVQLILKSCPKELNEASYDEVRTSLELSDTLIILHGPHCGKFIAPLCELYLSIARSAKTLDTSMNRILLNALGNLMAKGGGRLITYQEELTALFIQALVLPTIPSIHEIKVVKVALRGLSYAIEGLKKPPVQLDQLIERLVPLMRLTSGGKPGASHSRNSSSTTSSSRSSHSSTHSVFLTDSDLSDGGNVPDSSRQIPRPFRDHDRVRQNAFTCLAALAKVLEKLQLSSLTALTSMIDTGHLFLSHVSDRNNTASASFISLSERLSQAVHDIHAALCANVRDMTMDTSVLLSTLQCMVSLVKSKVFSKMALGYVAELYDSILPHLHGQDPAPEVRQEVLATLACIIGRSADADGELARVLMPEREDPASDPPPSSLIGILKGALSKAHGDQVTLLIPYSSLIAAAIRAYPLEMRPLWDDLTVYIMRCLNHLEPSGDPLAFAGMHILCEYTKAFSAELDTAWWEAVIEQMIQPYADISPPRTKSALCEVISYVSSKVVEQLNRAQRVFLITYLLGTAEDASASVRAAACRSLGIWVALAREDELFLLDAANSLLSRGSDEGINVRIRASWALANLCDTLFDYPETRMTVLSVRMESRIARLGIKYCGDNDKVRPNGVRILGNILHLSPKALSHDPQLQTLALESMMRNISVGTFKLRWNTCYALGRAFANPSLSLGAHPLGCEVIPMLGKAMSQGKNMKVRISACVALKALGGDRSRYGAKAHDEIRRVVKDVLDESRPLLMEYVLTKEEESSGYEEQYLDQLVSYADMLGFPLSDWGVTKGEAQVSS